MRYVLINGIRLLDGEPIQPRPLHRVEENEELTLFDLLQACETTSSISTTKFSLVVLFSGNTAPIHLIVSIVDNAFEVRKTKTSNEPLNLSLRDFLFKTCKRSEDLFDDIATIVVRSVDYQDFSLSISCLGNVIDEIGSKDPLLPSHISYEEYMDVPVVSLHSDVLTADELSSVNLVGDFCFQRTGWAISRHHRYKAAMSRVPLASSLDKIRLGSPPPPSWFEDDEREDLIEVPASFDDDPLIKDLPSEMRISFALGLGLNIHTLLPEEPQPLENVEPTATLWAELLEKRIIYFSEHPEPERDRVKPKIEDNSSSYFSVSNELLDTRRQDLASLATLWDDLAPDDPAERLIIFSHEFG